MLARAINSLNKKRNDWKPKNKILNNSQNSDQYLSLLFRIQALFGVTYCGNTPLGESNGTLIKVLLICYDLSICGFFIGFELFAFNEDVFNQMFSQSTNKGVMN